MPAHRKPLEVVQDRRPERVQARVTALLPVDKPLVPPRAPKGLLRPAHAVWAAFWKSDVARAADREADMFRLVRWITAVSEWHRVSRVFQQSRLVKGSMGQPTLNPLAAYLSTLEATIQRAETEFGMGPMARSRLGIQIGQARLTAAELNRQLRQEDPDDDDIPELAGYDSVEAPD